MHMKHVCGLATIAAIQKYLQELPSTLDEQYRTTINRVFSRDKSDRQLAARIISLIYHAKRPLSVHELQHALSVDEAGEVDMSADLVQKAILLDVCCGLVVIDQESEIIRFARRWQPSYIVVCTNV